MTPNKIQINRAPVLTLWASAVAERLGFNSDEALSVGKALAGLNAQSKGRRLGIFKPVPKEIRKVRERERGEGFWVELLGRQLPAVTTDQGVRSVIESKPIEPEVVEGYLESKFGDALPRTRRVMRELAKAVEVGEFLDRDGVGHLQPEPEINGRLVENALQILPTGEGVADGVNADGLEDLGVFCEAVALEPGLSEIAAVFVTGGGAEHSAPAGVSRRRCR